MTKLFDFFDSNKRGLTPVAMPLQNEIQEDKRASQELPEIPEPVFIAHDKPVTSHSENIEEKDLVHDLQLLYKFLERNLEHDGYKDALVNPDSSHLNENLLLIKNQLSITISKVKTYYHSYLRTIDFHIESRRRNGMVDTVDELVSRKENTEEELRIVADIEKDAQQDTGLSQSLIMSYKKGFRNGFAAITYSTVFAKKP